VFYNSSNEPILTLNGTVQATGTAQSYGSWASLTFTVTHNAYPTTFANQTFYQQINAITSATAGTTYNYLIGTNFGAVGKGLVDSHQQVYAANGYSGTQLSEPVLGEMLMVLWATYAVEMTKIGDLLGRMTTCIGINHHLIGMTCYESSSSWNVGFFDIQGTASGVTQLGATSYAVMGIAWGIHGYALEQLAIQQVTGVNGASATRILHTANSLGTKIYKGTQANWSGTVVPALSGYNSTDLSNIYTYYLSYGYDVFLPQTASQTMDSVTGYGWSLVTPNGAAFGIIETLKGGTGTQPTPPWPFIPFEIELPPEKPPKPPWWKEPIATQSGDFQYTHADMAVGSLQFPYQLSFETKYNSSQRYVLGELGYGWTHNWATSATIGSDAFEGYGIHSPIAAAATIAEFYVFLDLATSNLSTLPVDIMVVLNECNTWWIGQQTKNVVKVSLPEGDYTYALLPDGTYQPPLNYADTLTLSGGTYTLESPQKDQMNFNSSGQLSTWVFAYGVTITLNYSAGILQSVSNGLSRTLTLSYTGTVLTGVSDGTRTISYGFDANHQLTKYTDATSAQTAFAYNTPGQMTQCFRPANPSVAFITNVYDTLGRVQSQSNARNQQWTYYFAGSRSEEVDPIANSRIRYLDNFGNVLRDIDPIGNEIVYEFDGLGRMIQIAVPEGNQTQWTYDTNNNPLTITLVPKSGSGLSNTVWTFTYDPTWAKVKTFKDANSNTFTYAYDPSTGNKLSLTKPTISGMTPVQQWTYNTRGQIVTFTEETGIVTQYNYDTISEKVLSQIVDYNTGSGHFNLTTSYGYNAWGDATSVTDPNLNLTAYQFDNQRRMVQSTTPAPFSYVTNYGYDSNGNLLTVSRQTGNAQFPWQTFSWTYSPTDKQTSLADPTNGRFTWSYDSKDRLQSQADALGREWQYSYDANDRLYQKTDPTITICETRLYTPNGLLKSIEDANSNLTQFSYDGLDRPNKTTYADTSYEQCSSYDANNNVLTFVARSGNTIISRYDALNRLSTRTPQGSPSVTHSYQYDLANRLTEVSKPVVSGDPSTGNFQMFFDTAGRFYKEEYPDGKLVTFQLDSNGNITKVTYPDGYYVSKTYDQLNRLTDIYLNGSTTAAAVLAYDELSRRTTLTFSSGAVISYTYDTPSANELAELAHTFVGSNVTFAYNHDQTHEITAIGVTDPTYMWHPQMSVSTTYNAANSINQYPKVGSNNFSYNGSGCLTSDGIWSYGYDTDNQLISASMTGTSIGLVYDPLQRQAQKSVTTTGTTNTRYIYSAWQRIADYDGTSGLLLNRYVYGPGLDEPLIQITSGGTTTFYHSDQRNSVIAISNGSGNNIDKNTYGPFGESTSLSGTTFGFTGQRFDSETGLYYFKHRYYYPSIGRFMQPDPLGGVSGLNEYTYANNAPESSGDPLGMTAMDTDMFDIDLRQGQSIGNPSAGHTLKTCLCIINGFITNGCPPGGHAPGQPSNFLCGIDEPTQIAACMPGVTDVGRTCGGTCEGYTCVSCDPCPTAGVTCQNCDRSDNPQCQGQIWNPSDPPLCFGPPPPPIPLPGPPLYPTTPTPMPTYPFYPTNTVWPPNTLSKCNH
jgi:RHS repeat-associated protein